MIQYFKSQKGKDMILLEGYVFQKDKSENGRSYWRCFMLHKSNCKARCITENDVLIKHNREHNHERDTLDTLNRQVSHQIKDLSSTTRMISNEIISNVTSRYSNDEVGEIRSVPLLKKLIQRTRKQTDEFPPEPTSRSDISIPENFTNTLSGNRFLLHDNLEPNERIILFCTDNCLTMLSRCREWFCDGTFKTVPSLFLQLYTIHVKIESSVVPAVYALLPNKTFITYNNLISYLRIYNHNLNPQRIVMDFEQGAIGAFKSNFPNSQVNGCFFHLSKNLWRKIQKNSVLINKYRDDINFAMNVKMIISLAFIPPADVEFGFCLLSSSQYFVENVQFVSGLVDYFSKNYIGSLSREGMRVQPTYPIELWNVYYATVNDQARTNNKVEGWHNSFSKIVNCSHPGLWKFLDYIKIDEGHKNAVIQQALSGQTLFSQRIIYKNKNERLKRILRGYDATNIIEMLRRIAKILNI